MTWRHFALALICVGLLATTGLGDPAEEATATPRKRPPIILISLDTLRADHVGSYGYARNTTPHLDRFAKDAVSFQNAFTSGGGTLPAHMTLLTSLSPAVHGVTAASGTVLGDGHETLAEVLRKTGYRTAAFTGAGYVRGHWGFDQGFDTFDDAGRGFEQILPKAITWLDEPSEQPPFLFLHTLDIHSDWDELPYDPPAPYRDRFVAEAPETFDGCREERCASTLLAWLNQRARKGAVDLTAYFTPEEVRYVTALYDGGVAYTDARFGELLAELMERDLYDDAIIAVVSDHGEEFLEHGLMLHEQSYDEIVRVPILVKLPGGRRGGTRVSGLVGMMDVMPTILEAAEIERPSGSTGASLLPLIEGRAPGRDLIYIYGEPAKVRTAQWSLLLHANGTRELYDLKRDPGEQQNIAETHPEVVAGLTKRLAATTADQAARSAAQPSKDVELSEDVVRQLKALGYLHEE